MSGSNKRASTRDYGYDNYVVFSMDKLPIYRTIFGNNDEEKEKKKTKEDDKTKKKDDD